ncbi:MAG: hypothetical protein E6J78_12000 [Deltaproteobacteria bacterium]|nr:MAG: hypothetical protein E6J78_12000 [Deltaproteobacteria bacterium]
MRSSLRAAGWSLSIGVLAVALAAAIFQLAGAPGAVVFLALLLLAVGLVSALVGLLVELRPLAGLAGGVVAAFLVAAVLALTINLAPLGPGAQRPTWRDLFWMPLFGLLAFAAACAAAGFAGTLSGLRIARRRPRA